MWIVYLFLLIIKGGFVFFGMMMIIRLILFPGFAHLYFEGRRTGENVLRNNVIFLIICWLTVYFMGVFGINIFDKNLKENDKITLSTKKNDNLENINQKDSFNKNIITTKCRVYKKETWIYSKNSFKNNEESKKYRIYKLTEGERVDVIIDWNEEPEDMVNVIYYDKKGDRIIGYMVTSSLQFLEAG